MTWHRPDTVLAGALIASIGLNGMLYLRGGSTGAADSSRRSTAPAEKAPGSLAPCPAEAPSPELALPASPGPAPRLSPDFDAETRDPAWASRQEDQLEAHLAELLRPHGVDFAVECRSRCCELTAQQPLTNSARFELQTHAGLTGWSDGISFSGTIVTCFDRKASTKPPTDLVRDRNRILESTSFAECARLTTVPMEVTILAAVDVKGGVQTVRRGELSGSEAARCVEKRIGDAARFGPQPQPRSVQFLVRIDPDGGG